METPAFDEPTRRAIAEALNTVTRYDRDYDSGLCPDSWGEWVMVEDVASALGLAVDAVFNEETGTRRGFTEKGS